MYPMRFRAGDVQSRVMMARLLVKMEEQPEISRELGLEDVTKYPEDIDETKTADVSAGKEETLC